MMSELTPGRVPVSVVVPCYRCARTLRRAVDSVVAQTVRPTEIILVDDGSEDDGATQAVTQEIASVYGARCRIKVLRHAQNLGLASTRNTGWETAEQPYVAFLDADDVWHPQRLEIQFPWLHEHPSAAVIGTPYAWLRDREPPPRLPDAWGVRRVRLARLMRSNPFNASSILLRRDVRFRFEPSKRYSEDYLLWLTLASAGYELYWLTVPLAYGYKPPYGYSGLSADLWSMEAQEVLNFMTLVQRRMISPVAWALATAWSVTKFFRRWARISWSETVCSSR